VRNTGGDEDTDEETDDDEEPRERPIIRPRNRTRPSRINNESQLSAVEQMMLMMYTNAELVRRRSVNNNVLTNSRRRNA
jgi:hypothetical protein